MIEALRQVEVDGRAPFPLVERQPHFGARRFAELDDFDRRGNDPVFRLRAVRVGDTRWRGYEVRKSVCQSGTVLSDITQGIERDICPYCEGTVFSVKDYFADVRDT